MPYEPQRLRRRTYTGCTPALRADADVCGPALRLRRVLLKAHHRRFRWGEGTREWGRRARESGRPEQRRGRRSKYRRTTTLKRMQSSESMGE
jgi:hypothetical protein